MESRAKLFGHSIHAMLITFPIGLFVTAIVFDIVHLVSSRGQWTLIRYLMIIAGIIGGLVAAVFGFVDFLGIPASTRPTRVGAIHGIRNVVLVVLFGISVWFRYDTPEQPPTIAFVLSFLEVALASVTAWLGGELLERLSVAALIFAGT